MGSGPAPASTAGATQVYPESHGKFQEEGVRSQPQEEHSYSADEVKKEKSESKFHIRRKASLLWMGLKMKAKMAM